MNITNPDFLKQYSRTSILAKNQFYTAYLAFDEQSKTQAVIKSHNFSTPQSHQCFQREIRARQILKSSKCSVPLTHYQELDSSGTIVQEYMANRSIKHLLRARRELVSIEIRFFLNAIIQILIQLQELGVCKTKLQLRDLYLDERLKVRVSHFYQSQIIVDPIFQIELPVLKKRYIKLIGEVTRYFFGQWQHHKQQKSVFLPRALTPMQSQFLVMTNEATSLYELLVHPLIHNEVLIPTSLPTNSLQCPPSSKFQYEYLKLGEYNLKIEQEWKSGIERLKEVEEGERQVRVSKPASRGGNRLLIKDFIDLSNSYGYGYKFSNLNVGFNFNDCTVLLMQISKKTYLYRNEQKQLTHYSFDGLIASEQLKKKMLFLNAFANQLPTTVSPKETGSEQSVFVTNYTKTKHASLLRMSNKAVQAFFTDKTQIYVEKELKIYIDKQDREKIFEKGNDLPQDIQTKLEYVEKLAKVFYRRSYTSMPIRQPQ